MSALGQERTSQGPAPTSALRLKADVDRGQQKVCFAPKALTPFLARNMHDIAVRLRLYALEEDSMTRNDYLLVQAYIIGVLLFFIGTTAIIEHPEWFRYLSLWEHL